MWKSIIRWTLLIPTSVLSGIITNILISFMLKIGWGVHGEPYFLKEFTTEIFSHCAFTIGFIYGGVWIAPKHKEKTLLVLVLFIILLSISIIIFSLIYTTTKFFSIIIASNVSAIITAILIFNSRIIEDLK